MQERTRVIRPAPPDFGPDGRRVATVNPPVQRGSTVLLPNAAALYEPGRTTYGRTGLATHTALIDALAALEGASSVFLFSGGLAALTATLLAMLAAGDEVLATDAAYLPARRFCEDVLGRFGVGLRVFPPDASAGQVEAMIGPSTRLILLESPGSLTFEVQDVPGVCRAARARGVLTLVDNTWAGGALFKPLARGADLSMQSLSKYAGGHADLLMGSVATNNAALAAKLDAITHDVGFAVAADDAYLALRGLRTMHLRLERQGAAALELARWLADQPQVERVRHPALAGSPGHETWARDFSGASGVFAFELRGRRRHADAFLNALELFGLGFSWGGFESLAVVCDPQLAGRRFRPSLAGPLIRLSIGLESVEDLRADLEAALRAAGAA